jgi:hypothetical protein
MNETDTAYLKMSFDAEMDMFRRITPDLARPRSTPVDGLPELRNVYVRAYERAFHRAATFDEADDPSLVTTPSELDETPYAEWWSKGNEDGDSWGRFLRSTVLGPLVVQMVKNND